MNKQNSNSCKCKKCLERTCCKNNGHVDLCDCEDVHRINFAGLKNHVNRKLNQCKHCEFEITTTGCSKKRGKTKQLGIDFVDMKEKNGKVVTVLRDKVQYFNWSDKSCKCNRCRDRHCDCHKHRNCDCHKYDNDDWCKHRDCDCHKHDNDDWCKHRDCDCHKHDNDDWCKHHYDCDGHKHHKKNRRKHRSHKGH